MAMSISLDERQQRFEEVVAEYLEAAEAGRAVSQEGLLQRHPDLAEEITAFFTHQEEVARLAGPLRKLAGFTPPPAFGPTVATAGTTELAGQSHAFGDYELLEEIGRGGMGVVYKARQLSLGRVVALKVLPLAATMDPRHLQRFHNEARAAAGLHHEHIVPVYAVGQERGVHYYAMQFIDGWTLAQFLEQQRQGKDAARPDEPAADNAPAAAPSADTGAQACATTVQTPRDAAHFRRVAAWGVEAAEALEHAHQLGIVHRDIKPGNLMLDGQGKLWVTDFGLARVAADSGLTLTGDLVGTLRYMSPEQALAKRVVIDHRTDVYSLGVTLYELLTGRPAVGGSTREEILRQILDAEPRRPRQLDRAIPRDLETIVLKASAQEPERRYATAQELADDLRRLLLDEPIRARRPSLAQRVRKYARRHRAAVWAIAVVALVLTATGLWYVQDRAEQRAEEARREADQRQGTREVLAEATRLQRQARWPQARAVLAQGLAQLGEEPPLELRQPLEQARRDLELVVRLDNIRMKKADIFKGKPYWSMADADYAAAFRDAGLLDEGEDATVVAARIRNSPVRPALVAALDDWASVARERTRRARLLEIARRADPDPLRDRLREPALWEDAKALAAKLAGVEVAALGPQFAVALGVHVSDGDAIALLTAAQARFPDDFWLNHELGEMHRLAKRWDKAIGYYRAALAVRPDMAVVHLALGVCLGETGGPKEAVAAYRHAVQFGPELALAHCNLGAALMGLGRLDEAIGECQRAIELDDKVSMAHTNLGSAFGRKGQFGKAVVEYRKAIKLDRKNVLAHRGLGHAFALQKKLAEAVRVFRQSLDINPDDAETYFDLGNVVLTLGNLPDAEAAFRNAVKLKPDDIRAYVNLSFVLRRMKRATEAEAVARDAVRLRPTFAMAHKNLGNALFDQQKFIDAEVAFRKVLELGDDSAATHNNLAGCLLEQGRFAEGLAALRKSHEIGSRTPGSQYPSAGVVRNVERMAELDAKLPRVLKGEVKPSDARECLELARICESPWRALHAAAVRLYAEAMAADHRLAVSLKGQYRYRAARAAALAGCGQGKDAGQTDYEERLRLRRQALTWLRTDVAAYRRLLDEMPAKAGPVVRAQMEHWKQEKDLAGVRTPAALAGLPAAERKEWHGLWTEVDALQRAAGEPAKKTAD
jgi:serine/threonine protein kinase/Tfp pilus assembly protein PilF